MSIRSPRRRRLATERYFLTELAHRNGFHVSAAENAEEA